MTGAQLLSAIRAATLVDTTQVSDADLLVWVNEGYYRVAAMQPWPWLEAADTLTTTASTQSYQISTAIDASVRRIVAVYDDTRRVRLRRWSATTAINTYGDQWPSSQHASGWFVWADYIYLIPVPSASSIVYKVLFHKAPTAITTVNSPEFDSMFHSLLAHYGEYRMWQREEDFEKAATSYAHFEDMAKDMASWYNARFDDNPWQVGVPDDVAGGTNMPFLDGL